MNLFSLSSLLLAIFCFLLSLIIYIYRDKKIHLLWAFFNFSVASWAFGIFWASHTIGPSESIFFWRLAHIGGLFISVFFYHTVCEFCHISESRKKVILFSYLQCLLFLMLIPTKFFISTVRYSFGAFYYNKATTLYSVALFIWFIFIVLGFFELFKAYHRESGLNRYKIWYFLFGFFVGFLGGGTYFVPMYGFDIYPIGNFTIPIYCLIATYAIAKYRLLDINIIFTRASIFIAIYLFVLGIPFALAFGYQNQLISFFGTIWWVIPLVSSTFLATIGPFFYLYINKKAEDRLLREQRSYQDILRNASSGMIRIKDLKKLLNLVVRVIIKTVKLRHASVYLFNKQDNNYILEACRWRSEKRNNIIAIDLGSPLVWQLISNRKPIVSEEVMMRFRDDPHNKAFSKFVNQLSDLDAAVIVPSFVEKNLIGILILGEKLSGKLYSEGDLVVFSVLANQAALAIENAQFYNEVKRTHEQLFQAEKMATIGTMADGLSHQINNRFHALSLISGDALDLLKTTDLSQSNEEAKAVFAELRSALERIEANVLQGGEVVKGLLKYSRPGESGFESVDFRDVVNGAIDMVQYKIKIKEIDLIKNIPEGLPCLNGNLTQLQEVFFNMIDNAYDAIKERQAALKEEGYRGRVEITAMNFDGFVEISFSDNGMGVKDLDKKKLFTPFFTTKATAKKGTGLGLYVIEKIISAHNGKLTIESRHGSGTRFTMTLPLKPKV